jgi:tRNA pseudouridine38-40 synthase
LNLTYFPITVAELLNHRLLISYDGTKFSGWQIQAQDLTIQSLLEKAIETLWGQHYGVQGSGRTDSGVHALGQVAHFQAPAKFKQFHELRRALNHNLPAEIRVLKCTRAALTFHARFSCQGKEYLYRIYNDEIMPPFELNKAYHQPVKLNLAAMQEASRHLLGRHDFSSFASNPGYTRSTMVRTMQAVQINRRGSLLTLRFRADGFLYRMVRNLTGALIKVGRERITPDDFKIILEEKKRSAAPQTAPAHGLYLHKVFY